MIAETVLIGRKKNSTYKKRMWGLNSYRNDFEESIVIT